MFQVFAATPEKMCPGAIGAHAARAEAMCFDGLLVSDAVHDEVPAGQALKVWQGRRWYQRYGTAVTAVPGTSNHGWGSAVVVANATGRTLDWLIAHERAYGYSHEVQSESWHVRFTAGDRLTPAVLAYESSLRPKPPPEPEEEDDDVRYIVKGDKNAKWFITDGITKRWIDDITEGKIMAGSGLAKWNNGTPFVWPQDIVDDIEDVSNGGGSMVVRRKANPMQSLLYVGGSARRRASTDNPSCVPTAA